jgi:hypothetical protein
MTASVAELTYCLLECMLIFHLSQSLSGVRHIHIQRFRMTRPFMTL